MKNERSVWWKSFSIHLWRTFIAIRNTDSDKWGNCEKRMIAIVEPIYNSLSDFDKQIIIQYFSACWGTDRETVSRISAETGLSTETVWIIICKAEKAVIRSMGLI